MTILTDQAEHLASLGFRVFPMHGITVDNSCTCQDAVVCSRAGKHPRMQGWQQLATSNRVLARALFQPLFCANIGIATGNGLVVVDCDTVSAGGWLVERFAITPTYCVQTRQGIHYYFSHASEVKLRTLVGWFPQIDIRAEGGLVVAAGSTHQSGFTYLMCSGCPEVPQEAPDQLLAALPRLHARTAHETGKQLTTVEMAGADAIVQHLYVDTMLRLSAGSRNAELFRLTCRLYEMVYTGLLFESRLKELASAAEISGLTSWEIERTMNSAIKRVEAGT